MFNQYTQVNSSSYGRYIRLQGMDKQVRFIMKALREEEDGNLLTMQRVKDMIKTSIKLEPLKPLHKIVISMCDLDEIIHTVTTYSSNQNLIMYDLKERLNKMKSPKTKMSMYSNCKLISELTSHLPKKDMIRLVPTPVYNPMVEKAFTLAHMAKFEHF